MTYLASTAISATASHDAIPCGWDCGNGYAKLHSTDGEILIPSYFYQIDDHDGANYEALGTGSVIEYVSGDRLDLIGTRWLIGETAEIYHPLNYQRIVDDFKNKVTYGLQMLLGAIALMPKQSNYHLTVVASLHDSQAFATDLKKALQGNHIVKLNGTSCGVTLTVQVTEEGIGALIVNRVPGQRKVALIDLGHGTTITSIFEGNKLLQNSRIVEPVGVYHLCSNIANNIETRRKLNKPASIHLIREGIYNQFHYGTTGWQFDEVYAAELKPWLKSCLVKAFKHLQARADDLDATYLIGGGANLPSVSAIASRQGIATIQNSQLANVQGLLKLATLVQKQEKNNG
ncbi:ParM/StbA family protein [Hassallia byssoidea VB512170]|uniref:ParM/StbA family protein n=1 Tax=Hassallia byssoidea VB512170 TaxID=1304833 RepID=A0A846HMJ8_9CYAN|nr:ParM/StbA family protein [Hassalia byssoidea]NEU77041.1 ParM/StbA family protein [Hassalia byssoidea VB512170]